VTGVTGRMDDQFVGVHLTYFDLINI